MKIVPIVEGDGEVEAVPLLLRRILHEQHQRYEIQIARPKDARSRNNLTKDNGIERFLMLAKLEKDCAGIFVVLDTDTDCAMELAQSLAERTSTLNLPIPVVIVCATCEYEAWFLASLATIAGRTIKSQVLISSDTVYEGDVEAKRGAKEWLNNQFPRGHIYKETEHQVAFTEHIDFALAREKSRSFRRLEHALEELLAAMDENTAIITPRKLSTS